MTVDEAMQPGLGTDPRERADVLAAEVRRLREMIAQFKAEAAERAALAPLSSWNRDLA